MEKMFFFFYEYSLRLCLKIAHLEKKPIKILLFIIIAPFAFVKGILSFVFEITIGRLIIVSSMKKDTNLDFKYDLGIVAIAKNESTYVREWVTYYLSSSDKRIHFFLYDNESEDDLYTSIKDYIEAGYVDYIPFPGIKRQLPAYDDAIRRFKNDVKYMAFIDLDEFVVPTENEDLFDCVDRIISDNKAVGLGINWKMFGSSGYKERIEGGVIERFTKRAEDSFWGNEHVKTIANPRFVRSYISCHYPQYRFGGWSVNSKGKRQRLWTNIPVDFSIISINHYFCKSEEEFWKKRSRGRATTGGKYDFSRFNDYDRNEVDDYTILRYKEKMMKLM